MQVWLKLYNNNRTSFTLRNLWLDISRRLETNCVTTVNLKTYVNPESGCAFDSVSVFCTLNMNTA
jgi:hypothetical protein